MIIGLYSSAPQSGKSTVGKVFADAGYNHISFATPVKQSIVAMLLALGVKRAEYYVYHEKDVAIPEIGKTGGFLLSSFATTWARNMVDQNIWLNAAKAEYKRLGQGNNIYIDDIRFMNEFSWIRECGGVIIHVKRDCESLESTRTSNSEGNLNNMAFDYVIENDGTLADLERMAGNILEERKRCEKLQKSSLFMAQP